MGEKQAYIVVSAVVVSVGWALFMGAIVTGYMLGIVEGIDAGVLPRSIAPSLFFVIMAIVFDDQTLKGSCFRVGPIRQWTDKNQRRSHRHANAAQDHLWGWLLVALIVLPFFRLPVVCDESDVFRSLLPQP